MTKDRKEIVVPSAWGELRRFTQARIGLGRAGTSLPTSAHLDFQFDHARARDAVHRALDVAAVMADIKAEGLDPIHLHSAAATRAIYLQRPDLGRSLEAASRDRLKAATEEVAAADIALVIGDGLSAYAIEKNVGPFLKALLPRLAGAGLSVGPVAVAEQARVALGDEIGEVVGVPLLVMLIGERPGLSSPDSLGVYMTWGPARGRTDADRNCISNVRPDGLSYEIAANKLLYLIMEARRRQLSGVQLKDETESDGSTLAAGESAHQDRLGAPL